MPQSLILEFQPGRGQQIKRVAPQTLHGLLFRLIAESNPELAESLHQSKIRSFTLSPPFPAGPQAPGLYRVRCTLLDSSGILEALNQYFLNHLGNLNLRIGQIPITITRFLSTPSDTEIWSEQASYDTLWSEASSTETRFALKFCSPTAFKTGETILPLPLPERVFGSYLQRWNAYSPYPFDPEPIQYLLEHQLAVEKHQIESSKWHYFMGFTGQVRFVLTGKATSPQQIQQLNALANFAYYCGTGYKTAMGCGWTRRLGKRA